MSVRTLPSPSPRPSPSGRGRIVASLSRNPSRFVFANRWERGSLKERATALRLSLIDNGPQGAPGWHPLLLWRRGTGRGGPDFCNPQHGLKEWPEEVGQRPKIRYVVDGLLSPALSSKGGEGEDRFVDRVNRTRRQWRAGVRGNRAPDFPGLQRDSPTNRN